MSLKTLRNSADFEIVHRLRVVTLLSIYLFIYFYSLQHTSINNRENETEKYRANGNLQKPGVQYPIY